MVSGVQRMLEIDRAASLSGAARTYALLDLLEDPAVRGSRTDCATVLDLLRRTDLPAGGRSTEVLRGLALDRAIPATQREDALEIVLHSDPPAGARIAAHIACDPDERKGSRAIAIALVEKSEQQNVITEVLGALLRDPHRPWRRQAAMDAKLLPDGVASQILAVALQDADPVVRSDAANTAANLAHADPALRLRIEELAASEPRWWRRAHLRRCASELVARQ